MASCSNIVRLSKKFAKDCYAEIIGKPEPKKAPRPLTIKEQREANLLSSDNEPGFGGWLSHELATTAQEVLELALHERRRDVLRSAKNHTSSNAVSAIVMTVNMLDAAMTELILSSAEFGKIHQRRPALLSPMLKFLHLSKLTRSHSLTREVETLIELRHEIVHFLPHSRGDTVPPWFELLEKKGLFIKTGGPNDFHFTQKLPSYGVAYWAWEVVDRALARIVPRLPRRAMWVAEMIMFNAQRYRAVLSPNDLAQYDEHYGLTLNA